MDNWLFIHGAYRNLLVVESIKLVSEEHGGEHVELRYPGGEVVHVRGYDARVLLAKLRGADLDEIEIREYPGKDFPGATSTINAQAAVQAQELAKTLGGSQGRTFDFQDSTGQNKEGVVVREEGRWVAIVDEERYVASSEAGAMQRAMGAA